MSQSPSASSEANHSISTSIEAPAVNSITIPFTVSTTAPIAQYSAPIAVPSALADEEDIEWQVVDEDDFHERFRHSTMEGLVQEVELDTPKGKTNFLDYIKYLRNHLEVDIQTLLAKNKGIIFWVAIQVRYVHPAKPEAEPFD